MSYFLKSKKKNIYISLQSFFVLFFLNKKKKKKSNKKKIQLEKSNKRIKLENKMEFDKQEIFVCGNNFEGLFVKNGEDYIKTPTKLEDQNEFKPEEIVQICSSLKHVVCINQGKKWKECIDNFLFNTSKKKKKMGKLLVGKKKEKIIVNFKIWKNKRGIDNESGQVMMIFFNLILNSKKTINYLSKIGRNSILRKPMKMERMENFRVVKNFLSNRIFYIFFFLKKKDTSISIKFAHGISHFRRKIVLFWIKFIWR
jgi:hypothetical protein